MSNIFVFILILTLCSGNISAQKWVNLTAFKDEKFQDYLTAVYPSLLSSDKTQINVLGVEKVAINSETYRSISTLEGIKELVNLKYLYLPGCTASNYAFSLKSLDVSGMKHLEIIDNAYFVSVKTSTAGTSQKYTTASASQNKVGSIPFVSLKAEDCPALKYVGIGGTYYKSFKEISLKGSTNVEALYIGGPAITKIDISELPKLENKLRTTGTNGAYSNSSNNLNEVPNFGLILCTALEELIIGEHPNFEYFSVIQCSKVAKLDISGLTGLTSFCYKGSTTSSATSTESPRGAGALYTLTMAEDYPNMNDFTLYQTSLRHFDASPVADHVTSFVLRGSYVQEFDVTTLKKATGIDVSFNCLHKIDLPYLKTCKDFYFKYNRATYLPYPGDTHTKLVTTSNGDYQEQIVNVGPSMKYKIFDDPSFVQYVMFEDGGGTSTKRNYYAPYGGHIGVEADGEDPCYFYFDDEYVTGSYFFYFPNTNKGAGVSYVKVTLNRNYPDDNDYNFYLSGDFNDWTPAPEHRFVLTDPANGIFNLNLTGNTVSQHFRVWDDPVEEKVITNWGGHETDKYVSGEGDGGDHIYFIANHKYTLGEDPEIHYTTYPQPGKLHNHHVDPSYELRYVPEAYDQLRRSWKGIRGKVYSDDGNYLRLSGNIITDVRDISIVESEADAPVEYFNLQGMPLSQPVPGQVVIRRQGSSVTKILVQ